MDPTELQLSNQINGLDEILSTISNIDLDETGNESDKQEHLDQMEIHLTTAKDELDLALSEYQEYKLVGNST